MGKWIGIIFALLYYLLYPLVIIVVVVGPFMEFSVLLEIFKLNAPREGLTLSVMAFIGFILFLSYKIPQLGWLYRKWPVMMPLLQIFFITLIGIESAIFFANLWADKELYDEWIAIVLGVISIILVRVYLSYWYSKHPISYKVHKM